MTGRGDTIARKRGCLVYLVQCRDLLPNINYPPKHTSEYEELFELYIMIFMAVASP